MRGLCVVSTHIRTQLACFPTCLQSKAVQPPYMPETPEQRRKRNRESLDCHFDEINQFFYLTTTERYYYGKLGSRHSEWSRAGYVLTPHKGYGWVKIRIKKREDELTPGWGPWVEVRESCTRLQAEAWLGLDPGVLILFENLHFYFSKKHLRHLVTNACRPKTFCLKLNKEVPRCLARIPKIRKGSIAKVAKVYFLVRDSKVVYVGQTTDPWPSRILEHMSDKNRKDFDSFYYLDVPKRLLGDFEMKYIKHFQPKYNIVHTEKRRTAQKLAK